MSSDGTVKEHHENCQVRNYAGIPGSVCTCGLNISKQPTEMKSLRDIKDKLDGVLEVLCDSTHRQRFEADRERWLKHIERGERLFDGAESLSIKLDAIAESQGKLYSALDGLNAGIAQELGELRNFLNLEIPRCVNLHTGWQIERLIGMLAKPPRKRAAKRRRK